MGGPTDGVAIAADHTACRLIGAALAATLSPLAPALSLLRAHLAKPCALVLVRRTAPADWTDWADASSLCVAP
eukprot:13342419-Alexandrium_andersonii.AAC.1